MTALKTLARMQRELIKAQTPKRKPVPRKGADPETEALMLRRSQIMRGR